MLRLINGMTGDRPIGRQELAEVLSLAAEIQVAEGLDVDAALHAAVKELDSLKDFAHRWDRRAVDAGNRDAIPF